MAFNPIGTNHTVTFTCNNAAIDPTAGTTSAAAGCYAVTASVQNSTTGDAATFISGDCQDNAAFVTTATIQCDRTLTNATCAAVAGIAGTPALNGAGNTCTVNITTSAEATACVNVAGGTVTTPVTASAGVCTYDPVPASEASFTINSGAPDVYTFTVSGYVPAVFPTGSSTATCPAGTTGPTLVVQHVREGGGLACQFFVFGPEKVR